MINMKQKPEDLFDFVVVVPPERETKERSWYDIERDNGYEPMTTFWDDFNIADKFGADAINDTYNRAFNEWKSDYKYLTELVLVLNHKCWAHWQHNKHDICKIYSDLFYKTQEYAFNNLKDEELSYFTRTID